MKTVAIILANGSGERAGFDVPKQLIRLAGKPIINWTLDAFLKNTNIDKIYISTKKEIWDTIVSIYPNVILKKIKFIEGGETRNKSTTNALNAIANEFKNEDPKIIIHDSVRPLITQDIINRAIESLEEFDAVDVVISASDTIIQTLDGRSITDIPDRKTLRYGQTPQGFRLKTLEQAYKIAELANDTNFTDDCGVVKRYLPSTKIGLVEGAPYNHKLTYKQDLFLLEKIIQTQYNQNSEIFRPHSESYFQGKVILIIGGFTGIGAKIATTLTAAGAKVINESTRTGFDLKNTSNFDLKLKQIHDTHGRIDAIICSSAVLEKGPLTEMSDEAIYDQISINLTAPLILGKHSFKYLKETKGCLVYFTSSSYTLGRASYSAYSASKAGVVNMVQALSDEWANDYVRVIAICPERTETELRMKSFGKEASGTLLDPETVALETSKAIASGQSGVVLEVRRSEA